MLDAPATDPPSTTVATYTLRDVPPSRRSTVMRDMMGDGHKPFVRARPTVTREDGEAPYDGSFEVRTTGELVCVENFSEAAIYTRTPHGAATSPIDAARRMPIVPSPTSPLPLVSTIWRPSTARCSANSAWRRGSCAVRRRAARRPRPRAGLRIVRGCVHARANLRRLPRYCARRALAKQRAARGRRSVRFDPVCGMAPGRTCY
jgi:hypothetical protein